MEIELQRIFRALPFSCLILRADEDFTIVEASDAYLATSRVTREYICGQGVFSAFPQHRTVPPSHGTDCLRSSLETVCATGCLHAMRIQRCEVPDGDGEFAYRYCLTTNHPVLDDDGCVVYIVHQVQDLTRMAGASQEVLPQEMQAGLARIDDRVMAYAARTHKVNSLLLEEERRWVAAEARADEVGEKLALVVDAAELGMFHCAVPPCDIVANATCKMHFFMAADTRFDIDRFYDLIHPEDRANICRAFEDALYHGRAYDVEYRVVAADGRMRWITAKGRVTCDSAGVPVYFHGITIDISQLKASQDAQRSGARQKDEFLAMLAHELRNPLAPIRSAAQLMLRAPMDAARTRTSCAIINRQAEHMTSLIDDLLDVSRVTRGLIVLEKQAVSLKEVLAEAIEQTGPVMAEHGHILQRAGNGEAVLVWADKKRLVQVFANLLNNAAKYTPAAGVITVEVEATEPARAAEPGGGTTAATAATATAATAAATVTVRVRDNGIGITQALQAQVFDLFTQAARTPDRREGGLGIGLALVKSLVNLHDGQVSASSHGAGHGTTFEVVLPRLAQPARTAERPAAAVAMADAAGLALEVVVVDDNEDAALMLAYAVESAGHTVHVEHGAHGGLTAVANGHAPVVDVCLLDIGLPELDGNEVARRLRANPKTSGIVLIAVTGYGQPEDIDTALQSGFDRCLVKPIDLLELNGLLNEISHSKAAGESLRKNIAAPY